MAEQDSSGFKQIGFWALISMTLGLAPFQPEPHIVGKLRWIAGGAQGMQLMDWFDVLLHGFPWVMLVVAALKLGRAKLGGGQPPAKVDSGTEEAS